MENLKELKSYYGSDWKPANKGGWMHKGYGLCDTQVKFWKGNWNPSSVKSPDKILVTEINKGKFSLSYPFCLVSKLDGVIVKCFHEMKNYCHYYTKLVFDSGYFLEVDSEKAAEDGRYFTDSPFYLAEKIKVKIVNENNYLYVKFGEIIESREFSESEKKFREWSKKPGTNLVAGFFQGPMD